MTEKPGLTRNQALVLDRLEKAEGPLSAYALLDQLREEGLRAPLQVYRALDGLMQAGHVHRLESWVGATGFRASKTTIELRGTCAKCAAAA